MKRCAEGQDGLCLSGAMEGQDQAYRRGVGWAIAALCCLLVIAVILIGAHRLGLAGGRTRAHDLMLIDTALGATLEPVDPATARELGDGESAEGMVVTSTAAGGPADSAGIRVGDVLERIQGRPAASTGEVAESLSRSPATVIVNRRGNRARVQIPVRSVALPGS
jgi:S1-C subfamily serine protease